MRKQTSRKREHSARTLLQILFDCAFEEVPGNDLLGAMRASLWLVIRGSGFRCNHCNRCTRGIVASRGGALRNAMKATCGRICNGGARYVTANADT